MSLVKTNVSPQEWQTRIDLAAAYRIVAHYGWDDLADPPEGWGEDSWGN